MSDAWGARRQGAAARHPGFGTSIPEVSFWRVAAGQSTLIFHPRTPPETPKKLQFYEQSVVKRICAKSKQKSKCPDLREIYQLRGPVCVFECVM